MTAAGRVVRDLEVDGRRVRVVDGSPIDAGAYARALDAAPFRRTEVARPDTAAHRHWVHEIQQDALARQPIAALTMSEAGDFRAGERFGIHRSYVNAAWPGDMLFSHVDCLPEQGDVTALWFVCEAWDLEWGGETVFFDGHDEIAASVLPRPGRLVLFDGAIRHAGRAPARICPVPRYTLAFKLVRDGVASR